MPTYTQPTTSLGYLGQIAPTYISVAGAYNIPWPDLAKGAKIGLLGGGGGGGGGGGAGTTYGGGGGAPGEYIEFILLKNATNISGTLGAGGAGGFSGSPLFNGTDGAPGGQSTCARNLYNGGNGGTYFYTAQGGNPGTGGGITVGIGGIANSSVLPTALENWIIYGGLSGGNGTNSGTGAGIEGQPYINMYLGHGGYGGNRYSYNNIASPGITGKSGAILIQWF